MRFLFLLVLLLAGCSVGPPPPDFPTPVPATATPILSFPVTVTGDDGRSITLATAPKRIVSMSPGHTESLFAIGAGDLVVGVDQYSDHPAEAVQLPKVGYATIDLERLVSLNPDLVIVVTRQRRAIPDLDRAGLPNLYLSEAENLDTLLQGIVRLGDLTGQRQKAQALVDGMRGRIGAIMEKLQGVDGPSVFYELSPQLHTASDSTFIGDMLARIKLKNIAVGSTTAFPQISQEHVIAANPDVIILGDGPAGETPASVKARPGWQGIKAVRDGRVLLIENISVVVRPGPRVVEGMEMLARMLYPDRFR